MRVKQMQAMVAATLLFGGVLLGTHTSYAALGKVVDIAEVKESEADRTSYRGRVEKPIDEVYAPREAKTDKNEIKAEAKPQDGTAAVKRESAGKDSRESTVPRLSRRTPTAVRLDRQRLRPPNRRRVRRLRRVRQVPRPRDGNRRGKRRETHRHFAPQL